MVILTENEFKRWVKIAEKRRTENATLKKALELALKTFLTREERKPSIEYWANEFMQQAEAELKK